MLIEIGVMWIVFCRLDMSMFVGRRWVNLMERCIIGCVLLWFVMSSEFFVGGELIEMRLISLVMLDSIMVIFFLVLMEFVNKIL